MNTVARAGAETVFMDSGLRRNDYSSTCSMMEMLEPIIAPSGQAPATSPARQAVKSSRRTCFQLMFQFSFHLSLPSPGILGGAMPPPPRPPSLLGAHKV